MSAKTKKVTAADMRVALSNHFAPPACALIFEVANATGANTRRHLDAIAMELWPSRGLTLHGIEIKVSRGDFMREKANPEKAEAVAKYCDLFSIAAPAGMISPGELPSAWGLIELNGRGLKFPKAATKTDAKPLDRHFLAACLRAADKCMTDSDREAEVRAIREKARTEYEGALNKRVESMVARANAEQSQEAESWRELIAAIRGDDEASKRGWLFSNDVIAAIRALQIANVRSLPQWLGNIETTLEQALAGVREGRAVCPKDGGRQ